MKEEALPAISPEQAQRMLAEEGLQVTLEQAIAILHFLNKLAQITLDIYMVKPQ